MSAPRVLLKPSSVESGDTVELVVEGIPTEFAGRPGEVIVVAVDQVETHWNASIGGTVMEDGRFFGQWQPSLLDETVLETAALRLPPTDGDVERHWDLSGPSGARCIVGGATREWTAEELSARADDLREKQVARYDTPIGDPSATGAREHRVLCIVERLRSTRELKLPGARLLPLTVGNPGSGEPPLIDAILEHLAWPARVESSWWTEHSADGRPWTALVIGPVFAPDHDVAAKLAWEVRDRLIDVISVTRGSSARALASVVEQREEPSGVKWRIFHEDERYRGNLMGGFIAGEDQRELLLADAALSSDPLLAMSVRLFRDAQGEKDADAAYFRYWNLLETLSGGRFTPPHAAVTLLDGSTWPGPHNSTEYPAPRVYALIASHLAGIDESSTVTPATSLYEAVRAWYARRNATGHYGRFNQGDPTQQAQAWFKWPSRRWAQAAPRRRETHGSGTCNRWPRSFCAGSCRPSDARSYSHDPHVGCPEWSHEPSFPGCAARRVRRGRPRG